MIRTKQVVISRIAGARLTTVNKSITCKAELSPSGLVHCSGPPAIPAGSSSLSPLFGASCAAAESTSARLAQATASQSTERKDRPRHGDRLYDGLPTPSQPPDEVG